jgi:prevent-host-death family protein
MGRARTVNSSTFKAQCLALIKEVKAGRLDEVIVTRRGQPAVRLTAIADAPANAVGYGFMKGRAAIAPDVDLLAPVIDMPPEWPPAPQRG